MTQKPRYPIVLHLFPEILDALLDLLRGLADHEWSASTVCPGWSVHDVALHLLGGDVGILSRQRDGFELNDGPEDGWDELVAFINQLNDDWIQIARRISPRLLIDLLAFTGPQVNDYFRSLDPEALGGPVSWAGPDPAPVGLDLAREYTERWHHQQHIRDAVGRPGLAEPRYLVPVLSAFVQALPHTFRQVQRPDGAAIEFVISGPAGGRWFLLRSEGRWRLDQAPKPQPHARATIDQDDAWRLFTKGLSAEQVRPRAAIEGDEALGEIVLQTVSIIA